MKTLAFKNSKLAIAIVFMLCIQLADAQENVFEELVGTSFSDIYNGSTTWFDYDNDGDLDILLTGSTSTSNTGGISKIYSNDSGTFTEVGAGLTGVSYSSVDCADYDNDGDVDILLTGQRSLGEYISKIYCNNGDGTFSEQINISLLGVRLGSVAWGDYNNDGFSDILLTGTTGQTNVSKIYKNNKDGTFSEQTDIELPGVSYSSVAWGDYDNDGFLDILLTGATGETNISKVYRNNGNESFSEQANLGTAGAKQGSVAWGDYDNDGFLDILLVGRISNNGDSKIHRNNGDGTFSEQTSISLQNVYEGSVAWGDYDNDGDLDIFLTGNNHSIIYQNNSGTFTDIEANLPGINQSSVAWADYDNDNDLDILLAGMGEDGNRTSKLFTNTYTTPNTSPAPPQNINCEIVNASAFFNWDKVASDETPANAITYNIKIGRNAGENSFIPSNSNDNGWRKIVAMGNMQTDTSFLFPNLRWDTVYYASIQAIDHSFIGSEFTNCTPISVSATQLSDLKGTLSNDTVALQWKRGNGDKCILFAKEDPYVGEFPIPNNNASYYYNNKFGEGSPDESGWYCIYKGTANSTYLTGLNPSKAYRVVGYEFQNSSGTEIYESDNMPNTTNKLYVGSSPFTKSATIDFEGVYTGSSKWGDYDNDGDLDILLSGETTTNNATSKIYNNHIGDFTDIAVDIVTAEESSTAWGDYDNDGDLDILIMGDSSNNNLISRIYQNTKGVFTNINAELIELRSGEVNWGDYDNDGDLDILISGWYAASSSPNYTTEEVSKIYRNDAGIFTDINAGLIGDYNSSSDWGDYDNDGDLDVLIAGSNIAPTIYRNDGNEIFTEQTGIITDISRTNATWGDYDNDGDLDILLTGYISDIGNVSKVYQNNAGVFTDINAGLIGVEDSSFDWGDYDNDGDLDILLTGTIDPESTNGGIAKIYRNDAGLFTEVDAGLLGVSYGSVDWGDYDNDGDLDIIITGVTKNGIQSIVYNNNLFMNSSYNKNTKPERPNGLTSSIAPGKVQLNWNTATDTETPASAITYNLRYKHTDSTNWLCASHTVDTTTNYGSGHRLLPEFGNIQYNNSYALTHLTAGEYLWQIQAIDQGYLGSNWSDTATFEIKNLSAFFSFSTVCAGDSTILTDLSESTKSINLRQWKCFNASSSKYEVVSIDSIAAYVFPNAGLDSIMLVVEDSDGLKDSISHNIWVKARSKANFSAPAVCFGSETNYTDLCSIPDSIQAWYWDFGDNTSNSNPSNTVQQNYNYTYLSADTLIASLKVVGKNNCSDSIYQQVIVAPIPDAAIAVSSDSKFSFCENSGDSALLFVTPQANCTYQWLNNNAVFTGKTDNELLIKENGGNFTTIVTDTLGGCSETSNLEINITVNDSPDAPTINTPSETTICEGDTIELFITPIEGLTYKWYGGLNTDTSNIYHATTHGVYSLEVSNIDGCTATSTNSIDIVVNGNPEITGFSYGDTEFCYGDSVVFSVSNNTNYTYDWVHDGNSEVGTNRYVAYINGNYSLRILNPSGCFNETATVPVTIYDSPTEPTINTPINTTICEGDTVELFITPVEGLTYKWYGGLNTDSSNIYYATTQGKYSLEISNAGGCNAKSTNSIEITVKPQPDLPSVSYGDTEICEGESVALLADYNNNYTYQWIKSFVPISRATLYKYTANETGEYWLKVSEGECSVTTNAIPIHVYGNPVTPIITEENNNTNYCLGTDINLLVDNASSLYNYQWQRSGINIDEETSSQLSGKLAGGDYSVIAMSEVCEAGSDILTLETKTAPEKPAIYASGPVEWVVICDTREAEGYRWYYNGELITGANLSTYFANRNLGEYYFEVNDGGECWTMSDIITIPTGEVVVKKSAELITVSPNPSSNIFKIGLGDEYTGSSKITVYNSFGKIILIEEHNGVNEITLDFSNNENGIYPCNVDIEGKVVMMKLIKQ